MSRPGLGGEQSFRLLVVNPNSDGRVTQFLAERAAGVLPPGAKVDFVDCPASPKVIETAADDILAGPDVLRAALDAPEFDALLLGCFGDPAVQALREVFPAPVVGLGQAALMQASIVTSRFGVVTTLERGIPSIRAQLAAAGVEGACAGVEAIETAAALLPGVSDEDIDELGGLVECGRRLLAGGADGLVLACAAFGRLSDELSGTLAVPVCDGIGFAATALYGLWACGITTSKRGAYSAPLSDLSSLASRPDSLS